MVYHHRPLNIINLLRNGLLVSIYRVDTDVPCQNRFSEPFDRENKTPSVKLAYVI